MTEYQKFVLEAISLGFNQNNTTKVEMQGAYIFYCAIEALTVKEALTLK